MTSRLKRKLETQQQDGGSNSLTESFVSYGTALPSLADTKKDSNEFVPVWEQTVTDEKGRRRFHGAFTGGFSAGYFNTVGTKEGWAPSQFTSSRSNRATAKQTANDFMDEEDLESIRATQKVAVNQDFDILGGTQSELAAKAGPSSEAFLLNMVQPGKDKIGEKLLRKMGWREGQGVGPRVSAKARRRQAKELGLRLDLEEEDDAMVDKHLFAPLDRPLVLYPEKTNVWGLGYRTGATLVDSIGSTSDVKGKSRMKAGHLQEGTSSTPLGGAFGISALEDADEDDCSVYDTSARGSGQRIMDLDDDDNGPSSYEISRKTRSNRPEAVQKPSRPPASTETYHDGTPALPGFSISSLSIQPDIWFEPPDIPRDWQPSPKRVFDLANKPTAENGAVPVTQGPSGRPPPPTDARGRPVLSADDRGSMLGEDQIKAPPRSVFDFISAKNKERISQLTSKASCSPASSLPSAPATQESVTLTVPILDKPTAVAALKGFMPFGDDHAKQDRYRFYLRSQAGELEGTFNPKCEPGRTWELNKELEDFAKSAKVFKPMSSAMAGRFVSSSSANTAADMKTPQAGLRNVEMEEAKEEVVEEKEVENLTPAAIAVRTGQFGILTRSTENFYPVKLLCKRFNVPDPHPDGPVEGEEDKEEKELLNKQKMDDLRQEGGYTAPQPYDLSTTTETTASTEVKAKSSGTVGLGEDEGQGKETLTYERPPMDLFKAIFAESESESEDEENKPVRQPAPVPISEEATKPALSAPPAAPSNPLEPISFTDFKPTFVPKSDRTTSTAVPEKKKKDKKKKKAALSFAVEEDEEDALAPKEKRKKSKDASSEREKKRRKETPAEDEWVEKEVAVPRVAARIGRARASDFL